MYIMFNIYIYKYILYTYFPCRTMICSRPCPQVDYKSQFIQKVRQARWKKRARRVKGMKMSQKKGVGNENPHSDLPKAHCHSRG